MFLSLSIGETAPRALCPVPGPQVQERPRHTGKSPMWSHQDEEGTGAALMWAEEERAYCSACRRGGSEGSHQCL